MFIERPLYKPDNSGCWQVWWADAKANRASRERMVSAALREDALVIAAHIRGVGKLRQTADGIRWVTVDAATRQGT